MFIRILFLILLSLPINIICSISFVEAMVSNQNFKEQSLLDPQWALLKAHYDHYLIQGMSSTEEYKIPKIIHHIWVGSPIPDQYKQFRQTWIDMHPGWQFILWDDEKIANLGLVNQKMYNTATNWGKKSDIARYEILYRYGGLYVDTDFVCLKSFDMFHKSLNFYAGIGYNPNVLVFNGLIAATPQHPIIKDCIYKLGVTSVSHSNETYRIMEETGPVHFTRCILNRINECDRVVIFPCMYFYPFLDSKKTDYMSYTQNEHCFAVHLYHCSWMK